VWVLAVLALFLVLGGGILIAASRRFRRAR
jgi:hypothetical protein